MIGLNEASKYVVNVKGTSKLLKKLPAHLADCIDEQHFPHKIMHGAF